MSLSLWFSFLAMFIVNIGLLFDLGAIVQFFAFCVALLGVIFLVKGE